ncbi:MAPEG family protein [Zavarzinia sp.]|uniref:MAPEG family protein n=1 Tax=Zavarzinia sp. TaxID=2027920 RepID=UPI003565FC8F
MSIAVLCIIIAVLMPAVTNLLPKLSSVGSYDNNAPRLWLDKQTGWRQRATWAHNNHNETLAGFVAAVILCLFAGVDRAWLDQWAMIYIAVRVVYTAIYIANIGPLRTLVWVGGMAIVVWMMIKAGTALAMVAPAVAG